MHIDIPDDMLEHVVTALQMRAAFIETGTPTLRRNDAIEQRNPKLIRALDSKQEALVRSLDSLAETLESGRRALALPAHPTRSPRTF